MSKNYLGIIIILICSFLLLPQITYSSSKDDYELQVKCGKQSEEKFEKYYGSNGMTKTEDGDQLLSNYENHYNKKLHKCFVILTTTNYTVKKETGVLTMKNLYDINENKEYGSFSKFQNNNSPIVCKVLDKFCKSEKEWDKLVKPYMTE